MGGEHNDTERLQRQRSQVPGDPGNPYELVQPKGYFMAASGDTLPWFDKEGRAIVLLFHHDGSVTWQLRDRNGEVLEPEDHR